MIEVGNLSKYYGPVAAVRNISFRVERGEILGFLGPNGAGKTTTMRILTCYLPATSGTATVAGYDVFQNSLEVRRRIGYMPEHPPLYLDMTVGYYLKFVSKIKEIPFRQRNARIEEIMGKCGITHVADTIIGRLSKGYRQRVGLAQALVHDPDVLILDEPTIGLDPNQTREVRDLIKSFAGDHTVILSTHILPEVSVTCDRVIIIHKGRIVAQDTPQKLTADLQGTRRLFVQVRGASDQAMEAIREIQDVLDIQLHRSDGDGVHELLVESGIESDIRAQVASKIVGRDMDLLEMRPVEMSLEDIFTELTTSEEEVAA